MSQVLFLDDDADLREVVAELLTGMGIAVVPLDSHEALVASGDQALRSDLAILDINLGPGTASGLDSYRWLQERGFKGRIAMLTGHARSHPLVQAARHIEGVEVLEKPISVARLEALVAGTRG